MNNKSHTRIKKKKKPKTMACDVNHFWLVCSLQCILGDSWATDCHIDLQSSKHCPSVHLTSHEDQQRPALAGLDTNMPKTCSISRWK